MTILILNGALFESQYGRRGSFLTLSGEFAQRLLSPSKLRRAAVFREMSKVAHSCANLSGFSNAATASTIYVGGWTASLNLISSQEIVIFAVG